MFTNQLNVNALNNIYQNGTLNFANPAATPNAFNGLFQEANNLGISKLDTIDATLSTPNLFHLPAGDVGIGFGAQFTHQSETLTPGSEYLSGAVITPDLETVDGQRNVAAIYYQINIPIIENLTFSQAGRYDHYTDVGGAFSPRFALRYQPIKALTLRRTTAASARRPSSRTASRRRSASRSIRPPARTTRRSPSATRTSRRNARATSISASRSRRALHRPRLRLVQDPHRQRDRGKPSQVVTDPTTGQLLYKVIPYQNLGYLDTNGFEGTFRQGLPLKGWGTITLSGDWAYVNSYKIGFGRRAGQRRGQQLHDHAAVRRQLPAGAATRRWTGTTGSSMRR